MTHRPTSRRRRTTKSVLRLLDLEHAKTAVLNTLTSPDAQRGYRHAIDEFVDWYCSEPRLAFNRIVVLCYRSPVVRVDFSVPRMTIVDSHAFSPPSDAENLPITVRDGWMFVRGTIKVPGKPPVSDEFLLDSGSEDAVNHPIIRESKGPLQKTRTGAGGFGSSLPGVIGPNEWFELGRARIPSTVSACCTGTPEVSRQIGLGILSRFVITFDYLNSRMYVQKK